MELLGPMRLQAIKVMIDPEWKHLERFCDLLQRMRQPGLEKQSCHGMILPWSYHGEYESPWSYHVIAWLSCLTMAVNPGATIHETKNFPHHCSKVPLTELKIKGLLHQTFRSKNTDKKFYFLCNQVKQVWEIEIKFFEFSKILGRIASCDKELKIIKNGEILILIHGVFKELVTEIISL